MRHLLAIDVSPDGRRYAYSEDLIPQSSMRVHIADAATGSDLRVVTLPDYEGRLPYFIIDFTNSGVDLGIGFEGQAPGIWNLDPDTGALMKVSDSFYPPNAPWIGVADQRDPHPYQVGPLEPAAHCESYRPSRLDRPGDDVALPARRLVDLPTVRRWLEDSRRGLMAP